MISFIKNADCFRTVRFSLNEVFILPLLRLSPLCKKYLVKMGSICPSTNFIPCTISANLFQFVARENRCVYFCTKFFPVQRTAVSQTTTGKYGKIISFHLFRCIAAVGMAVGTMFTDAVCSHGQSNPRIFLLKSNQCFRHVSGKGFAIAVTTEKCSTKSMVWSEFMQWHHAVPAVSGAA